MIKRDGLYYDLPVKVGGILTSVNQNSNFEFNKEYMFAIDASVGEKFVTCLYIDEDLSDGQVISRLRVIKTSPHR